VSPARPLGVLLLLPLLAVRTSAQTAKPAPAPAAKPQTSETAKAEAPPADLRAIARMVEKDQLAPAEQQLRRILTAGGPPPARELLGVVLIKQGRLQDAERELQKAVAQDPNLAGARQHLARLYLEQKREEEAIVELRRAALRAPLERDLALKLAEVELARSNPALAERQLRSAAERGSVRALLLLARLQSSQKDGPGALETLQRALALAPNSEEALSAMSQVSLAAHAPVPAILALEPLSRMCPTVGQYHYLLGVALMQAGDVPAAVEPLQKADELEPNHPLTLVALGLALNSRKLYSEAKPALLRALGLEPENVEAAALLAEAEEGLDDLPAAEASAERALRKDGGHGRANLALGMVRMKQQRYQEARDHFEKAVAGEPGSPKVYYQLSLALARLHDEAGAQRLVGLYQQKLKEAEQQVERLRAETGLRPPGGMRP
jgi:tetratricopeptide (TPR) repeat protein